MKHFPATRLLPTVGRYYSCLRLPPHRLDPMVLMNSLKSSGVENFITALNTVRHLSFIVLRVCVCVCVCVCVRTCTCPQSRPVLCDFVDCCPPGSSVHGISQARILEWVAISFFRGDSQPRDPTHVSCIGRHVLFH